MYPWAAVVNYILLLFLKSGYGRIHFRVLLGTKDKNHAFLKAAK